MAATIQTALAGVTPGLPGGSSSACNVTAPGVIKAAKGICAMVSCLVTGSITLNDSATTGGAAASNAFFEGSMTAGQAVLLNWPCFAGITASAVSTGTFAISFT